MLQSGTETCHRNIVVQKHVTQRPMTRSAHGQHGSEHGSTGSSLGTFCCTIYYFYSTYFSVHRCRCCWLVIGPVQLKVVFKLKPLNKWSTFDIIHLKNNMSNEVFFHFKYKKHITVKISQEILIRGFLSSNLKSDYHPPMKIFLIDSILHSICNTHSRPAEGAGLIQFLN